MLGLVVAVVAELVTPLDDVLGRCHDGERERKRRTGGVVSFPWSQMLCGGSGTCL